MARPPMSFTEGGTVWVTHEYSEHYGKQGTVLRYSLADAVFVTLLIDGREVRTYSAWCSRQRPRAPKPPEQKPYQRPAIDPMYGDEIMFPM